MFKPFSPRTVQWKTVICAKRSQLDVNFTELWQARDLVKMFVWRDFIAIYKQTILGPLWHVIQPLLSSLLYALVFGKIAGLSTDNSPTFLFYMVGTILWTYFSACLINTSTTFVTNTQLLGKVYFPRLTIPIAIILSNLIAFSIQVGLTGFLMLIYTYLDANFHITGAIVLIPLLLLILALMSLGGGLIVAALTTKYRDLAHLVKFSTQLLMFITPVLYCASAVPTKYQIFIKFNPLSYIFEAFRFGLLGHGTVSWCGLLYSSLFTLVTLLTGVILFNKVEQTFMDTV